MQREERRAGASYLAQHDPVMWFGLGQAASASDITIRWPSGREELLGSLPAGWVHIVKEGSGRIGGFEVGAREDASREER